MKQLINPSLIPQLPVDRSCRPQVYEAFAKILTTSEIHGVGANVNDLEILRLACMEKVCRDLADARDGNGFVLNFLANVHAPWANDLVTFWHEGLGYGWNLLVNDGEPSDLLARILFRPHTPFVFALFPIPARLPGFDCDVHEDFTFARYNKNALPLSLEERTAWQSNKDDYFCRSGIGDNSRIDWGSS
jgi:hypothetical protein